MLQRAKIFIKNQQGVSLLLAILVLSAVMAIAFSLATILLTEINASGDLIRSTTSLYGSYAQTEDGIYKVRRGVTGGATAGAASVGTVNVSTSVSATTSPTQIVKILAGKTNTYDLVDPNNSTGGSNYTKLNISYLGPTGYVGGTLQVSLYEFDPASAATGTVTQYPDLTSTNNTTGDIILNSAHQYQIRLTNTSSTVDMYAMIATYISCGTNCYTPYGLPAFDQSILNVNGTQGDVTRRIQVVVPKH